MDSSTETIFFSPYQGEKITSDFKYSTGSQALVDFFNNSAKKCVKELISRVFVIKNYEFKIVGFMAISLKSVEKAKLSSGKTGGLYNRPAIVIGQLIIDENSQGKGYGKKTIKFVIRIAYFLRKFLPCRLLFVDAIDDNAKEFYEKHGFQAIPEDPYTLVLDLLPIFNEFEGAK